MTPEEAKVGLDTFSFVESSPSEAELVAALSEELQQRAIVVDDGKAN